MKQWRGRTWPRHLNFVRKVNLAITYGRQSLFCGSGHECLWFDLQPSN
jgi:hypothetical protein